MHFKLIGICGELRQRVQLLKVLTISDNSIFMYVNVNYV